MYLLKIDIRFFDLGQLRLLDVPRQMALSEEVDEDNAKSLEVIASWLFIALMAAQWEEPLGPDETSIWLERDVGAPARAEVTLRQTEVDKKDGIGLLSLSNHDVLGLDVSMYEALRVKILDALNHLHCD